MVQITVNRLYNIGHDVAVPHANEKYKGKIFIFEPYLISQKIVDKTQQF
jgi:hypothetical protein